MINQKEKHVLRSIGMTLAGTGAVLCFVSTLAVAQVQTPTTPPGQPMNLTCSRDDGQGTCTAARMPDGKEIVVFGQGLRRGAAMTCVDRGNVVDCRPATK